MIATAPHSPITPVVIRCENEPAWKEERRRRVQASEIGALMGVGYANQNEFTVYGSKVCDVAEEEPAEIKTYLRVGKLLEPALRTILASETGFPCTPAGEYTIYQHPDVPFIGATLDSWVEHPDLEEIPGELKAVSYFAREGWDDEDNPPLKFQTQLQCQMFCTGKSHGILFGLVNQVPVIRLLERNERFIDLMVRKADELMTRVARREPPPVDASEATRKMLGKLFPKENGASIPLKAEAVNWAVEAAIAKAVIKEAEALQDLSENQLKLAIGDATFGDLPNVDETEIVAAVKERLTKIVARAECVLKPRLSWKQQTRKGFYVNETSFRVLRNVK